MASPTIPILRTSFTAAIVHHLTITILELKNCLPAGQWTEYMGNIFMLTKGVNILLFFRKNTFLGFSYAIICIGEYFLYFTYLFSALVTLYWFSALRQGYLTVHYVNGYIFSRSPFFQLDSFIKRSFLNSQVQISLRGNITWPAYSSLH